MYLYSLLSVENKAPRILITYMGDSPTPILNGEKWDDNSSKDSQASKGIPLESFLKSCSPRAL